MIWISVDFANMAHYKEIKVATMKRPHDTTWYFTILGNPQVAFFIWSLDSRPEGDTPSKLDGIKGDYS